jgi:FixJ family two-component response regulator
MIAIIDDDMAVREATGALLRSLGFETTLFSSALEFLTSTRRHTIACVISDLMMPGMSGIALQQTLAVECKTMPIIFVTAYPGREMQEQALSSGAYGFFTKPYCQQSLIECVRSAVRRHS